MKRLRLDRETPPEDGATAPLDQPDPRSGDEHSDGDDAVELKLGEEKHPLYEAVVRRARSTEDETEDGAQNEIDRRHRPTNGNRIR